MKDGHQESLQSSPNLNLNCSETGKFQNQSQIFPFLFQKTQQFMFNIRTLKFTDNEASKRRGNA